jgi:hypothetical protein
MWRVCTDLPFEVMSTHANRFVHESEIALARQFVEALDRSTDQDFIDPDHLTERRVFVRIEGDASHSTQSRRLEDQLQVERFLGLPIRVSRGKELLAATMPALCVRVFLSSDLAGHSRGLLTVSHAASTDSCTVLGKAAFDDASPWSAMDGTTVARLIERAVATTFVVVKPVRRNVGATILRVENHLPFTLAGLTLRAGSSADSPLVSWSSVRIGPGRVGYLPIQAATASVEHIMLNGL